MASHVTPERLLSQRGGQQSQRRLHCCHFCDQLLWEDGRFQSLTETLPRSACWHLGCGAVRAITRVSAHPDRRPGGQEHVAGLLRAGPANP